MEALIKELVRTGKSISVIETKNLRGFGASLTRDDSLGVNVESFMVKTTSTSPKGTPLISERRRINTEYPKDNFEKAGKIARVASEFYDSDFGVGICGNMGIGNLAYIGIYEKTNKSVIPILVKFDKKDSFENKTLILLRVKSYLLSRLSAMPNAKKEVSSKVRTQSKQGK